MMDSVRQAIQARDALLRQWALLVEASPKLDLDLPSRVEGWRNRDVVAHLAMQPPLLGRFLLTAVSEPPKVTLNENLSGTRRLASVINDAAIGAADEGSLDLAANIEAVTPSLLAADLASTVTTIQGPILLSDYLVTRCLEAVVHGGDLVPSIEADGEALVVAAEALIALLAQTHPNLTPEAGAIAPLPWVEMATGRRQASGPLARVMPLVS